MRAKSPLILKKIAPDSIFCGGSSDYKKPSLNTLEQPVIMPYLLPRGQPTHFLEDNSDNTVGEGPDVMTRRNYDISRTVERTRPKTVAKRVPHCSSRAHRRRV